MPPWLSRWNCNRGAKSLRQRLQAVLLFDEADIYLPAGTRQPATKATMEDLLKRARSAGVGIPWRRKAPAISTTSAKRTCGRG
jgi:hypothetical protein